MIHDIRQRWLELRDPVMLLADSQHTLQLLADGMDDDPGTEPEQV